MRNVRLAGLAFCVGTLMTLTGCMTTPGNYENVGSVDEDVAFNGWIQQPSRWVKIQARVPGAGDWEDIGWALSGTHPYSYSGKTWYNWEKDITIPMRYWLYLDGHYWAEVRAIDYSSGDLLYTFEAGYYDFFEFTEPLGQLWMDHGYGTSVTIAAD